MIKGSFFKTMGRTRRTRIKNKNVARDLNLSSDRDLVYFMQWMTRNGWSQLHRFQVSEFKNTGRGVLTKESVHVGDSLVKIPKKLLITLNSVSQSEHFTKFTDLSNRFSTQQLLAAFLVFQRHLAEKSFWYHYINSLPKTFPIPAFYNFSNDVPDFLSEEISKMLKKMREQYEHFLQSINKSLKCDHCNNSAGSIFDFESFKWAWCTVNSRAVYISPDCGGNLKFQLTDSNCLALAPYLDLFNHSNSAKVKAAVTSDGSYEITTLTDCKKFSQVFINYGQHSNLNLYLQYGFILESNINDVIPLSFPSIVQCTKKIYPNVLNSMNTYVNYISSHSLLKNPSLNLDGLSWSANVIIFILISSNRMNLKSIEFKVYSDDFDDEDLQLIKEIALILIEDKRTELGGFVNQLENQGGALSSGDQLLCHQTSINLIKEYLSILDKCESTFH